MDEMNLKQQQHQKETNDKIGWLNEDQQQKISAVNFSQVIGGLEHKQQNDHKELQRKMDESLKSVQAMVVAKLGQQNIKLQSDQKALLQRLNGLEQKIIGRFTLSSLNGHVQQMISAFSTTK
uniref:DUF3135 domain-containing protein n=1 Tax=Globodera pallida TaxID=36090 RepID=A0A183C3N5_GLOPA